MSRAGTGGASVAPSGTARSAPPTEALFYHLERQPLERVLPGLVERTLERGWRAVIQVGNEERLEGLDTLLWTYREDSFLPHGRAGDPHPDAQPVYLTTGTETPNGAGVRFLVDGADTAEFDGLIRVVYLFDGADAEAVERARGQWKAVKAAGLAATYWQQSETGRWEKKA